LPSQYSPVRGDLIEWTDYVSIAASTEEDYYFPLGDHTRVGTVDLEGTVSQAIFKGFCVFGNSTDVRCRGVAINFRDGSTRWIAADGVNDLPLVVATQSWTLLPMETLLRDVRNIMVRVHNSNAQDARYITVVIRYEPVR